MSVIYSRVHRVVKEMMKEKNIEDYKLTIGGSTGNTDGYMGEIVFFHVLIDNQTINLVLKSEKTQQHLKKIGSDIVNNRELTMYTVVIPALEKFTLGKNWIESSSFLPKLWFADKYLDQVNIVLEDLKLQNCRALERSKAMDFYHMSILFETYGKWHGMSMAFRDQHPDQFFKLVENWIDPRSKFISNLGLAKQSRREFSVIRKMLIEKGRSDLVEIYEGVEDQVEEVLFRENFDEEDLLIISHGDNWTTNYFFKYEDSLENSRPNQAYFIDFQLSRLDSPALELSSSLYNMGDKHTFEKFNQLLSIYHESLSRTLLSLGSNPDELFTMADLKKHWKKHGLYSVLYIFVFLRIMLCDPSEAPDLSKMAENGDDFDDAFSFHMQNMEIFWERALDAFIHYGESVKQL